MNGILATHIFTNHDNVVDIAVNPTNKSEYYVASGHGSLWKTVNNGVTYSPNTLYAVAHQRMRKL